MMAFDPVLFDLKKRLDLWLDWTKYLQYVTNCGSK